MSIEENKALARRWGEEIWDKGSVAAIDELLAPDFVFNYPAPGVKPDREAYKQTVNDFLVGFPDIQWTTEDVVAEGDKVAVRYSGQGTHKGEFMGIAPTGKRVTITGVSILRITGGKIVEDWSEVDNLGMMQQLGLFPSSGN